MTHTININILAHKTFKVTLLQLDMFSLLVYLLDTYPDTVEPYGDIWTRRPDPLDALYKSMFDKYNELPF